MSKPKFSWEPLDGGSLLLKVTNGDRETTWRVKKNCGMSDLYLIFKEVAVAIDDAQTKHLRLSVEDVFEWTQQPMVGVLHTVEEEDHAELSAKVASVTLTDSNWWDKSDHEELDLYELGTGDSE